MLRIYVGNAGTRRHIELMKLHGWGRVHLANAWRNPETGLNWFLDNGAFHAWVNNKQFDEAKFETSLEKVEQSPFPPDFIVCPDIVAAGYESLQFSLSWLHRIPGGYDVYLAVQDGMEFLEIEKYTNIFDGLFVGGSLPWKLKTGAQWVNLAHSHGIKCHIGRVGTFRRLVWAKRIGADSIDSSTFAQARKDRGFNRIIEAERQAFL